MFTWLNQITYCDTSLTETIFRMFTNILFRMFLKRIIAVKILILINW